MNRYFVIANDSDNVMIGMAETLEDAKKVIEKDAAQYFEYNYDMIYSIIEGKLTEYDVTPRCEFDIAEKEQ